jgi:hypothetical protein
VRSRADIGTPPSPTTVKDISTQIRNASSALLNLHPISLYYFIGAKDGPAIHYELVYVKNKEYIDALVTAKLATLQVVQGTPNDPAKKKMISAPFHGEKGLETLLTDSGKELLRATGRQG